MTNGDPLPHSHFTAATTMTTKTKISNNPKRKLKMPQIIIPIIPIPSIIIFLLPVEEQERRAPAPAGFTCCGLLCPSHSGRGAIPSSPRTDPSFSSCASFHPCAFLAFHPSSFLPSWMNGPFVHPIAKREPIPKEREKTPTQPH